VVEGEVADGGDAVWGGGYPWAGESVLLDVGSACGDGLGLPSLLVPGASAVALGLVDGLVLCAAWAASSQSAASVDDAGA
jgi:hypothetical protein